MSTPRTSRLLLGLAFLAAVVVGPSCAAPTLPLPPPAALVEGPPDADGLVWVSGSARAGAFVAGLNENTEQGTLTRADVTTGDFRFQIAAAVDDTIRVWQFDSTDAGGMPRFVTVPGI